jgi:hypothetical protein
VEASLGSVSLVYGAPALFLNKPTRHHDSIDIFI